MFVFDSRSQCKHHSLNNARKDGSQRTGITKGIAFARVAKHIRNALGSAIASRRLGGCFGRRDNRRGCDRRCRCFRDRLVTLAGALAALVAFLLVSTARWTVAAAAPPVLVPVGRRPVLRVAVPPAVGGP